MKKSSVKKTKPVQTKVSSPTLEDVKEPVPCVPSTDEPIDIEEKKVVGNKNLLILTFVLLLSLPIILILTINKDSVTQMIKPYHCIPITKVTLHPGEIITDTKSKPTELSALAVDESGKPVTQGVLYDWGISSSGSVGTITNKQDLATFVPLSVGQGDIFLKAKNSCTKAAVMGSAKVTVKDTSSATPSSTKKK